MTHQTFDYEDVCMGTQNKKPETYYKSFTDDYRLRSVTRSIKLSRGRILDLGCGGGRISEALPYYYPSASVHGCDVSGTAIANAKRFGSGKVQYKRISKGILPYANNYFNACICLDVMEHVPDLDLFLREVKRVLKKGGSFLVIVPCEGEPFTYTWVFQRLRLGDKLTFQFFGHIHPEFTHASVLSLLESHGFRIEKKAYSEHPFYQWMHVCIFFVPKLLLALLFGEKIAHEYTNSSLVRSPKFRFTPLMIIRNTWFFVFDMLMKYPMSWETILFSRVSFGAWKLHALARNQDKKMKRRKSLA